MRLGFSLAAALLFVAQVAPCASPAEISPKEGKRLVRGLSAQLKTAVGSERRTIIQSLGETRSPYAVKALKTVIERDTEAENRSFALTALDKIDHPRWARIMGRAAKADQGG